MDQHGWSMNLFKMMFAPKIEWKEGSCMPRTAYAIKNYPGKALPVYGIMPNGKGHYQAVNDRGQWLVVDGSTVKVGKQEDFTPIGKVSIEWFLEACEKKRKEDEEKGK